VGGFGSQLLLIPFSQPSVPLFSKPVFAFNHGKDKPPAAPGPAFCRRQPASRRRACSSKPICGSFHSSGTPSLINQTNTPASFGQNSANDQFHQNPSIHPVPGRPDCTLSAGTPGLPSRPPPPAPTTATNPSALWQPPAALLHDGHHPSTRLPIPLLRDPNYYSLSIYLTTSPVIHTSHVSYYYISIYLYIHPPMGALTYPHILRLTFYSYLYIGDQSNLSTIYNLTTSVIPIPPRIIRAYAATHVTRTILFYSIHLLSLSYSFFISPPGHYALYHLLYHARSSLFLPLL